MGLGVEEPCFGIYLSFSCSSRVIFVAHSKSEEGHAVNAGHLEIFINIQNRR